VEWNVRLTDVAKEISIVAGNIVERPRLRVDFVGNMRSEFEMLLLPERIGQVIACLLL